MKTILFVTSASMSTNPRCFKEAKFAAANGFKVHVMAFEMKNQLAAAEKKMTTGLKGVNFHYLSVERTQVINWLLSSLVTKYYRLVNLFSRFNPSFNNFSFDRRSWLTARFLEHLNFKPDLIIGHNPVVFYPVARAAKSRNIPYAIDVEDYHPGEGHNKRQQERALSIMQSSLPGASYVSYASPLIKEYSERLVHRNDENDLVVNNVFEKDDFVLDETSTGRLKLVWFSQHIGYNRGLENFLPILDDFKDHIQLDLIGMLNEEFYLNHLVSRKYINILPALEQSELNRQVCRYDIGLALENPGADINRDICLTNKIFAYRQAGLFILATKTKAQEQFIRMHQCGEIVTTNSFRDVLWRIVEDGAGIRSSKKKRFESARSLSWEIEKENLLRAWEKILTP